MEGSEPKQSFFDRLRDATGVVVESDGHGPISCRAEACRNSPRSWHDDDEPRKIELGGSDQRVRLSTKNGPVSVREAE